MAAVAQVMTPKPITIGPQASVKEAIQLMDEHDIRHLPVVDDMALVGIVSDRDLRHCRPPLEGEWDQVKFATRLLDQPVHKHMVADVVSVPPDATIEEAVDRVVERRVGCVCVVDPASRRLLGMVSQLDLLSHLRPI